MSVPSPKAADNGVAELSAAGEPIGFTILEGGDLILHRSRPATRLGLQAEALGELGPYTGGLH